jgi:hypothetical protein
MIGVSAFRWGLDWVVYDMRLFPGDYAEIDEFIRDSL